MALPSLRDPGDAVKLRGAATAARAQLNDAQFSFWQECMTARPEDVPVEIQSQACIGQARGMVGMSTATKVAIGVSAFAAAYWILKMRRK